MSASSTSEVRPKAAISNYRRALARFLKPSLECMIEDRMFLSWGWAMAQTATIELEYLMTVHATLQPPQTIDAGNLIFGVTGGWVEGPKIKAKVVAPGGDWLQVLPSGVARLDVRATMVTDDDQLISVSYNGVADTKVNGTPDAPYIVIAPTFGPIQKNTRG